MKQVIKISGAEYYDHNFEGKTVSVTIEAEQLDVSWQTIEDALVEGGVSKKHAKMYTEQFCEEVNQFELSHFLAGKMQRIG